MSITVVFDPPLPSDNPAAFNQKAFTLLGNLNTWSGQANRVAGDINAASQNAAANASNAAANASNAAASASAAATSASQAAASATNAQNSANAASASATAAANSFDAFDDRYLGSKTSNPTVDNDGNALLTGALYWNSIANEMRVWNGSSWQVAAGSLVGNADTATKLQTARTITIGNTGNRFDGSANVSWSLAEIGVTAATETAAGIVELATTAEAQALASAAVALTPARLADAFKGANQSLVGSGYQKLPGGLIIQWGLGTISNGGPGEGNFPVSFPSACVAVIGNDGGSGVHNIAVSALNTSQWRAWSRDAVGGVPGATVFLYVAIGY